MATDYFSPAWDRTHRAEGGYTNNPADPGGPTNHGITEAVARRFGYTDDMRDLPEATARAIAKRAYWDPLQLDAVASLVPSIAFELFDTNFNLWSGAAALFLQRSLNVLNRGGTDYVDVPEDGRIGNGTLEVLARYVGLRGPDGVRVMVACLNSLQCADYVRQCKAEPAKEAFFFGWVLKRVVEPAG
jgi:lysozyme family protein